MFGLTLFHIRCILGVCYIQVGFIVGSCLVYFGLISDCARLDSMPGLPFGLI